MDHNTSTNYFLIGKNEKSKVTLEVEKIPITKEIILKIIEDDYIFWKNKIHIQPGLEKFNLLRKVSQEIKINCTIFDLAADELEIENKIISFQEDNFKRYVLCLTKSL